MIFDDCGYDSKIDADVAKHFKNYLRRTVESKNSRIISYDILIEKDFDMDTTTKRAPFEIF
ncbi:hypothetical protein CWI36_0141p0020 [Hamiltosporidium magnivora]|uniref:Uncharacterized protein n=1 Tax=Hamiltosporidium magnivora TaxID=148818 RepID=A0A4Q9LKK4_9MICR|nr:hypothetical protein CWI36_0141p0020 [Hamiltosporidium magnivora]